MTNIRHGLRLRPTGSDSVVLDGIQDLVDVLEAEALATVPGSVFGAEQHIRLSYATSLENIREALERLKRFLAR